MGPAGAVNIVYRRELDRAAKEGADGLTGEAAFNKVRDEKIEEFREKFANPYIAAERGYIDGVIRPRDTRKKIIQALEMLDGKRDKNPAKKHGNIPL
jgi:propionyl-CoA carboxylase beta chain